MTRTKVAVGLFAGVSLLSFIAALLPVLKGQTVNFVFLGSGVVFLVIAIANARRLRASGEVRPPPNSQ